ncbi:hypothetical protein RJ639_012461 [Escallonia herrerae]|uniref:Cytochrome P450 n=1 Tax=Escallonia herrerae TaxID=1293975 RepID=A0AA88VLP3_9ASTE|nr:hypothetical protein RJ639_012461 [Escallonia herrerae]
MFSVGVESGELGMGEAKKGREVPQKPSPKNAGKKSFSWNGPVARVTVMDPELIKEILVNNNVFKKPTPNPLANYLVCGLPSYEDEKWAKHRKIVAPAFYIEKLKYMFPAMYLSCSEMVSKWEMLVSEKGLCELNVQPYLESLTSDVISRTAFGSSYQEGRKIFQLQKEQAELTRQVLQSVYIPGWRYLPTKRNKRLKEINDELRSILSGIIKKREMSLTLGESEDSDLLFLLLKSNRQEIQEHGNRKDKGMSIAEVIEECKTFYFAGQESTSDLLVWTMVLLSMHPNWQVRAREEVSQAFGNNKPDYDGLNRLKIVTMILYEVLRLYSPGLLLTRTIFKETKLGELTLPAGMEIAPGLIAISVVLATIVVTWTVRVVNWVWLRPKKLEKCLREQGLNGNPYRILHGDMEEYSTLTRQAKSQVIRGSDDVVPHVLPHLHHIINKYGKNSFIWLGPTPRVNIVDPHLIRDVLFKYNVYQKPPTFGFLVGGLVSHEGEKWSKHRKIVNPAFVIEKLKYMLPAMYLSCRDIISKWEMLVTAKGPCEVDVWPYLQNLTADVISRTAFGSSYEEGRRIFQLQDEQTKLVFQALQSNYLPGWRLFPTKRNKRMKEIRKEVHGILSDMISRREKDMKVGKCENNRDSGDDLLGMLLESNFREIQENGNKKDTGITSADVIEECKLFYFAGQETTSSLLVWTMVLLGKHQNWQARATEEISQVFGKNKPDFDGLSQLKIVPMILYEVLRLYPPATTLTRVTCKETKLGGLSLPPGVQLFLPIIAVHYDKEIWGDDAKEFKPERNMDVTPASIAISVLLVIVVTWTIRLVNWVWLTPKKLEKCMREQGCSGNPYRLLLGDAKDYGTTMKERKSRSIKLTNDIASHVQPYIHHLIQKYGENSVMWFGPNPRLTIGDPELMKEILSKPDVFQKIHPEPLTDIIAGGLLTSEDEKWANHRKIINPAFHLGKLKNMLPAILLSCANMVQKWDVLVSTKGSGEVDVWPYLEDLTGDVISRTAFGSLHEEGRMIFELQKEQINLALQLMSLTFLPGWRFIPTKANKRMNQICIELQALLGGIINKREKAKEMGKKYDDLLGILMESNSAEIQEHGIGMSIEEVMEECKLFYLAGSETTSNLLVWTMILLSIHPNWQTSAREEVCQVFGTERPNFDGLNRLKVVRNFSNSERCCSSKVSLRWKHEHIANKMQRVTMILNEVLRLYPPATLILRAIYKKTKLGNMNLPAGMQFNLPIILLHHNCDIWGEDAQEFKPERDNVKFAGLDNGIVTQTSRLANACKRRDGKMRTYNQEVQKTSNFRVSTFPYTELSSLQVTMILNEVLRLYPASTLMFRATTKKTRLGNKNPPAGVQFIIPIVQLHYDREIWGGDAKELRSERFCEGVSNATKKSKFLIPPIRRGCEDMHRTKLCHD